jgi:hypothetical protein
MRRADPGAPEPRARGAMSPAVMSPAALGADADADAAAAAAAAV